MCLFNVKWEVKACMPYSHNILGYRNYKLKDAVCFRKPQIIFSFFLHGFKEASFHQEHFSLPGWCLSPWEGVTWSQQARAHQLFPGQKLIACPISCRNIESWWGWCSGSLVTCQPPTTPKAFHAEEEPCCSPDPPWPAAATIRWVYHPSQTGIGWSRPLNSRQTAWPI